MYYSTISGRERISGRELLYCNFSIYHFICIHLHAFRTKIKPDRLYHKITLAMRFHPQQ